MTSDQERYKQQLEHQAQQLEARAAKITKLEGRCLFTQLPSRPMRKYTTVLLDMKLE